ncbi:TlpA disulfide reductase family protein [Bradyrhizobium sp. LHD-71]|uniref:thiol:disulfide interchange protein TlpA n=1 Tax=Bradyrhizobium sp. LHD-71 TaxID=3072141 RepID=UPI0028106D68|nr:TlpA disulfide reductase family protein [Bradyrhizobium sp. LHD-71]MDQ8730589.1 TlpA disulfide reductase family protein [Bradyrhizobium sp. LHD-71]
MTVNDETPKANDETPKAPGTRSFRRIGVIAVGALIVVAGVYGIVTLKRNAGDKVCKPTFSLARKVEPFVKGEVAAFTPAKKPFLLPDLAFKDASGAEKKLSDWRGRTVLLNLWATWCVPCRKEMPALDELQAKLGGKDFEVVAVNIDTRDTGKPKSWLKEVGISALPYFSDDKAKVFQDLKMVGKAFGMPTSILIDKAGCEIGMLSGPAEWASDDALKLVRTALAR